jgi:uncharacterized membrane protein
MTGPSDRDLLDQAKAALRARRLDRVASIFAELVGRSTARAKANVANDWS